MVKQLACSTVFVLQAWSRSLQLHLETDSDRPGVWWVGHFCTLQTTCWSTGLFGLQQATLLCWTFPCHYCLAQSHLTALIHYTFVLSPHLPRMFFSDMCSLSKKSGFLFVMFSDPSLWDFSCGSWSLKDVRDFKPFYLDAVYAVSLSNFFTCLPVSMCLCRLQKIGMLLWIPFQGRRNTLLDLWQLGTLLR